MPDGEPLSSALGRTSETDDIDFKSSFDAEALRDWLEVIKDIAAFANSGGGYILVGLNDDGSPSGADISALLAVDPADLGNRIHKYTGQHFSGVELLECEKPGRVGMYSCPPHWSAYVFRGSDVRWNQGWSPSKPSKCVYGGIL